MTKKLIDMLKKSRGHLNLIPFAIKELDFEGDKIKFFEQYSKTPEVKEAALAVYKCIKQKRKLSKKDKTYFLRLEEMSIAYSLVTRLLDESSEDGTRYFNTKKAVEWRFALRGIGLSLEYRDLERFTNLPEDGTFRSTALQKHAEYIEKLSNYAKHGILPFEDYLFLMHYYTDESVLEKNICLKMSRKIEKSMNY